MKALPTSPSCIMFQRCSFGFAFLMCLTVFFANAEIIPSDRRIDWVPGVTVGVRGSIPSNRTRQIDVTQAPYNANKTGSANASAAISQAINAAGSNDVVYLPDGIYDITAGLTFDKSDITIRGQSRNTVLVGHIIMGHSASGVDSFNVNNGGTKGSTNMTLANIVDRWGYSLTPGHMLQISAMFGHDDPKFPVISTAGYGRTIKQGIVVNSVNGNNITFSPPLSFNFTNNASLAQKTDFQNQINKPRLRMGLENLTIVSSRGALNDSTVVVVDMGTCVDSWITGCTITNANNYCLKVENVVHCEVSHNTIGFLGSGTSHSGLISADTSGSLFEDNIITDIGQIGFMFNDGFSGNAIFANFFNNTGAQNIDCHNTHPVMNLWEANYVPSFFEMDGYFGSASHQTLFRNRLVNTTVFKRWTSYMQVVGNVCGNTNYAYVWDKEQSGYNSPYPIFEMGYPNMGNSLYTGTVPPMSFNWPQKSYSDFRGVQQVNGAYTFTNNQLNTNILWGNFSYVPAPNSSNFPLKFQDGNNTNRYFPDDFDGIPVFSASAGTSSNLVLNRSISVSNGWTLYVAGVVTYQQLQASDKATHYFHGNLVYTNSAGSVVWDPSNSDHSIPASLLYAKAPSWWGTNYWPAIGPDVASRVTFIPAQERYLGIPTGTNTNSTGTNTNTITAPSNLRVIGN